MAESHSQQTAIFLPQKQAKDLSFLQLRQQVDAAIVTFAHQGIKRNMRVMLMVRPGLELIVSVFSLFKMGAVPVVIDPGMGLSKFLKCVRHTQPEALVGIPLAHWVARFCRTSFRNVRHRVRVTPSIFSKHALEQSCIQSSPDDLAAILFTSGSTGPAKGVCYEHGMFEAQLNSIRNHYAIEPGEIDLPLLPVFALFNPALGMSTVVPEMNPSKPATLNPARITEAINTYQVTNSFGSPALWRKIGKHCQKNNITLPSLRRILMAGAPVSASLVRDFQPILGKGNIHTPYGATESLPLCSLDGDAILASAKKQQQGAGTCVGKPLENITVKVIQNTRETIACYTPQLECSPLEVGEIIAQGKVVTRSYDNLPEATARAKILHEKLSEDNPDQPALWHRLGDLGYFDQEGNLWFCGRQAEAVPTAEGLYYTDCCEAIFNEHPHVARSALIGLGTGESQTPAIVIEPELNHFPTTKHQRKAWVLELLQRAEAHSHTAKIKQFFFCKKFPVDVRHNAKIHRLTLKQRFDRSSSEEQAGET